MPPALRPIPVVRAGRSPTSNSGLPPLLAPLSKDPRSARSARDFGLAAILTRFAPRPRTDGSTHFPGRDPDPEPLLGGPGLRAVAAAGSGSRRGYLSPGNVPARARSRPVGGGLRAAMPASDRRALWRKSEPPAAVLPVPSGAEAQSRRRGGTLLRFAARARQRSPGARPAAGRGQ